MGFINSTRRVFLIISSVLGLSGCAALLVGGGSYALFERRRIMAFIGVESGQINRSTLNEAIERQVQEYKANVEEDGATPSSEDINSFRTQLRTIYEEE